MKTEQNKLYYISPSWNTVLLFIICAISFALLETFDIQSNLAIYAHFHIPAIIISCIFSILATVSYSFYADYFEVRILNFTIRRICWRDVTGAMYFRSLANKRRSTRYDPYLIICLSPCQPVEPCSVNFEKYDRENLRRLIRIPIPGKEVEVFRLMEQLNISVRGNDL